MDCICSPDGRLRLALTDKYESWDFVNHGDPEGRVAIDRQLAQTGGKQLVFVPYGPRPRSTSGCMDSLTSAGAGAVVIASA
jgi:hypothetical protein